MKSVLDYACTQHSGTELDGFCCYASSVGFTSPLFEGWAVDFSSKFLLNHDGLSFFISTIRLPWNQKQFLWFIILMLIPYLLCGRYTEVSNPATSSIYHAACLNKHSLFCELCNVLSSTVRPPFKTTLGKKWIWTRNWWKS